LALDGHDDTTSFSGAPLADALARIGVGQETLREPLHLRPFEHWVGHIPFAFWIVSALRPRVLVELGTHRGNSFLAFCQAIVAERCGTRAYAVDTWEGDAHMAREDGVFEELSAYHDPRYGHFASLMRASFDDARSYFSDKSIDLLHIDGTHTYEAVKHDFVNWQSALSDRAVVLFHDTNVRRDRFGVWKLWEELSQDRPHFEFFHSFGLGVLGVGSDLPWPLQALFAADAEGTAMQIRSFFAARGAVGIERLAKQTAHDHAAEADRQAQARYAAIAAELAAVRTAAAAEVAAAQASAAGQVAAAQGEIRGLLAANEMAETACAALRDELRVCRLANDERDFRLRSLEAELHDARAHLANAESRLAEATDRLASTLASHSWRVTAPLRQLSLAIYRRR
jgi:hypothetical protein